MQNQNRADEPAAYYNVNIYEEIGESVPGIQIQPKTPHSKRTKKGICCNVSRYFLVSFVTFLFCLGIVVVLAVTGVYPAKNKASAENIKKAGKIFRTQFE